MLERVEIAEKKLSIKGERPVQIRKMSCDVDEDFFKNAFGLNSQ
jgi:hypothetical protein